jgi:hypothetical protein
MGTALGRHLTDCPDGITREATAVTRLAGLVRLVGLARVVRLVGLARVIRLAR